MSENKTVNGRRHHRPWEATWALAFLAEAKGKTHLGSHADSTRELDVKFMSIRVFIPPVRVCFSAKVAKHVLHRFKFSRSVVNEIFRSQ